MSSTLKTCRHNKRRRRQNRKAHHLKYERFSPTKWGHLSPSKEIPHGVRYSLTLHEPYGKRIMGYDNSHAIKPPKKFKYAGQHLAYGHKHRHIADKGVPYEFKDAYQLLADFFTEVDRVLQELKK